MKCEKKNNFTFSCNTNLNLADIQIANLNNLLINEHVHKEGVLKIVECCPVL